MNSIQVFRATIYALLLAGCALMFLPVLAMISTALKSMPEVYAPEPTLIPKSYHFENFYRALFDPAASYRPFNFLPALKNTVSVTLLNIIGNLVSCSAVAWGFARYPCRWNKPLFIVMLSAMMLPAIILSIPTFVLFVKYFGWYDTLYPLWVPSFFATHAFFIFLLHGFFKAIPESLLEAARIDGCSEIGIFSRVAIPLSKPALMVVAVFTFIWTWNDFFTPLLYLEDESKFTFAIALQKFVRGSQGSVFGRQWNLLMAANIVVTVPIVALFFSAQRYFVEGISLTGVKQ
jgi:multiple sugar transport system permease protein